MADISVVKTKSAFKQDDFVVYPGHGVGQITGIESQQIGGQEVVLYVIHFAHDRMTLRVPKQKVLSAGLRAVSTKGVIETALAVLSKPVAKKKKMWRHRALEYTAKINSADPIFIAEVVRELHRGQGDPEPSHTEREMYEQARSRLSREIAAVEKIEIESATSKMELLLNAA